MRCRAAASGCRSGNRIKGASLRGRNNAVSSGWRGSQAYFVRDGWIGLSYTADSGNSTLLDFVLPGEVIDMSPASEVMRHAATCLTSVLAHTVPRSVLERLSDHCPRLGHALLHNMASQLERSRQHVMDTLARPATERLARLFLDLFCRIQHRLPYGREEALELPLTLLDLAEFVGMTTVHVCRTLRRLREAEVLRFERQNLVILNGTRLLEMAGHDPVLTAASAPTARVFDRQEAALAECGLRTPFAPSGATQTPPGQRDSTLPSPGW